MQRTAHCVPTRVLIALPSWARGVAIVPCRTVATWHSLECPPGALRRQGSYTSRDACGHRAKSRHRAKSSSAAAARTAAAFRRQNLAACTFHKRAVIFLHLHSQLQPLQLPWYHV
jgi:hypothetical protein